MPPLKLTHALLFLMTLKICASERRILKGKPVKADKRYMAYLLKAPQSKQSYDTWLCGGAIVSTKYIVTSAACIEDVQYMYAIAGYKKYVTDVAADECTSATKKKIIFTCVPISYKLDYARVEKWSLIDIGIAQVESQFDFTDSKGVYKKLCSWIPNKIEINFDPKQQETDKDAYIVGWGATSKMRQVGDTENYNEEKLLYASTKIYDKDKCIKDYEDTSALAPIIKKYMICTLDQGNINEEGNIIIKGTPVDGCDDDKTEEATQDKSQDDGSADDKIVLLDETRRNNSDNNFNATDHGRNKTANLRRQGICQNDHGGPLVSWVGAHEVLIGVASVFRIDNSSRCTGPFLFTSTYCNGLFLDCVINEGNSRRRNILCDQTPEEKGFHLIERSISWMNHPAGPAENEVMMRPQVPLHEV